MADGIALTTGVPTRQWRGWMGLFLVIGVGVALVLTPAWIIQPFAAQTPVGLQRSYLIRQWSPLLTLVTAALALALIVRMWRTSRAWWRRAALVLLAVPALGSAWLARQNHFEWMFNPLRQATFTPASQATFVEGTDMVLAVERGDDAVAFPVRLLAYHHIAHDVVGGTPIVATY